MFTINGTLFEWDPRKAWNNLKKHRIAFEDAAYVFSDNDHIEYYDNSHSEDEDRFVAIGLVGEILFVVFTERNHGRVIRIISARLATPEEEDLYYENGPL